MQAFPKPFFVLAAVTILLGACAPAQPTFSPEEIRAQVETSVALTVAAGATQTAEAQPTDTATPTATLTPISVPSLPPLTPVIATATTFVVVPPSGGGGGGGSSTAAYSCDPDIDKRPRDNEVFAPNDFFDVKWTLLNTGTKTWDAGFDLTYFSGPQMTTATFVELPEVKPGKTFSVVFDANAPSKKGFYVMTWKLQGGWCWPYIAINVK